MSRPEMVESLPRDQTVMSISRDQRMGSLPRDQRVRSVPRYQRARSLPKEQRVWSSPGMGWGVANQNQRVGHAQARDSGVTAKRSEMGSLPWPE